MARMTRNRIWHVVKHLVRGETFHVLNFDILLMYNYHNKISMYLSIAGVQDRQL